MSNIIDSYYSNGKLHGHRGEDYAIHGDNYFIICDGCSSAKHSDVTARLQAHITKNFIDAFSYKEHNLEDNTFMIKFIGMQLEGVFKNLHLKGMPLATLMIGFIIDDIVRVIVVGDGNVVYKNKDNTQEIINISYSSNAPFYPYYYTDEKHLFGYRENYKNNSKSILRVKENEVTMPLVIEQISIFDFGLDVLEYLYIFSDGVEELKGQCKLPLEEAVKAFTAMKNTTKGFIQRRAKRQLATYEKKRIFPMDDFSMAGVYVNEIQN